MFAGLVAAAVLYLRHVNIPLLEPRGSIALKERNLIYFALGLSLIVVIPVFFLLGWFSWKYRESNHSARYAPELDHNALSEALWWAIPSILIGILSVVAWTSSHQLDPYRSISSSNAALKIQVIAMDWKWLFIYPKQDVASVNYFQMPVNTPVEFQITSDAPMNSFWIPQLGGQIYAMPGMITRLNLMATAAGSYNGWSANISGAGFADMTFIAQAVNQSTFNSWMKHNLSTRRILDYRAYDQLAAPGVARPSVYSGVSSGLFNYEAEKIMAPMNSSPAPKISAPHAKLNMYKM